MKCIISAASESEQASVNALPSIFISYSQIDTAFATQLEAELSKYGFDTWMDRRLEGGDKWVDEIEKQIKQRSFLVVVLSPNAIVSTWVKREILYAQDLKKTILPVLSQATPQVPIYLKDVQYIDFTRGFANGSVQLRAILTKAYGNSIPRGKSKSPDVPAINQNDLVVIAEPLPDPDPDTEGLYRRARAAFANKDWDTAESLLQRVVERDATYDNGEARTALATAQRELLPIQIRRLKAKADDAHQLGQWEAEIAYWNKVTDLDPGNSEARQRLAIAKKNQQERPTYKRLKDCLEDKSLTPTARKAAAQLEVDRLKTNAPYYGDPEGVLAKAKLGFPSHTLQNFLQQQASETKKREDQRLAQELATKQAQVQQKQAQVQQQTARTKETRMRAMRRTGTIGALWGIGIGMPIAASLATFDTVAHFAIKDAWIGLVGSVAGFVVIGGLLALFGWNSDQKLRSKLSSGRLILGSVGWGIFLGTLYNAILAYSTLHFAQRVLSLADSNNVGAAIFWILFCALLIGLSVGYFLWNREIKRNLPNYPGIFKWLFDNDEFTSQQSQAEYQEKRNKQRGTTMLLNALAAWLVFGLFLSILLLISASSTTSQNWWLAWLPGFTVGLGISLGIAAVVATLVRQHPTRNAAAPTFGLVAAAVSLIGGSTLGYTENMGTRVVFPALWSAVAGLAVGAVVLGLLGMLLTATVTRIRYKK